MRRLTQKLGCGRPVLQARGESRGRFFRQRRQLLGVGQARPFIHERRLLARLQGGRFDLADLERQQVGALRRLALTLAQPFELLAYVLPAIVTGGIGRLVVLDPGKAVQQVQMLSHAKQTEMLRLPMDVDQQLADFAQQGQADGPTVEARQASSLAADFTPEIDEGFLLEQSLALEDHSHLAAVGSLQPEGAFHYGRLGAGPHYGAVGPAPQQELDSVDDDRLAGAGLTGEDDEAGVKAQLEPLDNGEVPNAQLDQHRRTRGGCLASDSTGC